MAVERVGSTRMRVSWTALSPVEARGHITHYTVYYWPTSDTQLVTSVTVLPNTTTVVVGGLRPEETYVVQVSASTTVDEGNRSQEMTVDIIPPTGEYSWTMEVS